MTQIEERKRREEMQKAKEAHEDELLMKRIEEDQRREREREEEENRKKREKAAEVSRAELLIYCYDSLTYASIWLEQIRTTRSARLVVLCTVKCGL